MDFKIIFSVFIAILLTGALLAFGKSQSFSPEVANIFRYVNRGFADA